MNKDKNTEYEQEVANGKRKYQERLQEEREAQQLIDDFKKKPPEQPEIDIEQ